MLKESESQRDMHSLQVRIVRLFQSYFNISDDLFIQLDSKYKIMDFLSENYEYLHLQGNEGCLHELVTYLQEKGCSL